MPSDMPADLTALGLLPIHRAVLDGDLQQVQELLKTSINVDAPVIPLAQQPKDELAWPNGETPLMLAALMGHLDIFKHLVQNGADYRAEDGDGLSVRFYCTAREFSADKKAFWLKKGVGKEHTKAYYTRKAIADLLDNPESLNILKSYVPEAGYPGIYLGKEGTKSMS